MTNTQNTPRALALGFFDGVHSAHRAVLASARAAADRHGCMAAAVTFDRHPAAALSGAPQQLIQTLSDRVASIRREGGMDDCIVLRFDNALRDMEAEDFIEEILLGKLQAVSVSVGYDHRFGRGGRGDAQLLRRVLAGHGVECHVVERMDFATEPVASGTIRRLIAEGNVDTARRILGKPFGFSGEVIHDKGLGHTLGFPTMNVPMPEELVTPPAGVYTSRVTVEGKVYRAVTNVDRERLSETFVFDFDSSVYGHNIRVELLSYRRAMRSFECWDALTRQVEQDKEQAWAWFEQQGL